MQWRRCDRCNRFMLTGVMQHTFAECVVALLAPAMRSEIRRTRAAPMTGVDGIVRFVRYDFSENFENVLSNCCCKIAAIVD